MMVVICALLLSAAPAKYAMLPTACGDGVADKTCASLGQAFAAELRRYPELQLITYDEVKSVLNHEQQKQLLGCEGPECYADASKVLGTQFLIRTAYSILGSNRIVSLTVLSTNPVRVVGSDSLRLTGAGIDGVVDALPKSVSNVMEQVGQAKRMESTRSLSASGEPVSLPAGYVDLPLDTKVPEALTLLSDGHGHIVAYDTEGRGSKFVASGTTDTLFLQRVYSGSSGPNRFSRSTWDPRFQWAGLEAKDGLHTVNCGDKKVPLTPLGAADAKRLRKSVRFFRPRWQRLPRALARDSRGTYYFADVVRDKARRSGNTEDYRLYIGRKKHMKLVPLDDVVDDHGGTILFTEAGRLVLETGTDGAQKSTWFVGETGAELVTLDPTRSARMIYTQLGPYAGQPLGTICDPYL